MKTKKHIIIAGVPRSGKTTLCSQLVQNLQYQHLTMDIIMIAFEKAFPQTEIRHTDGWDFIKTSKSFVNFMKIITQTGNYNKLNYKLVFDMYHITPKDYYENIDKDSCDIYFFGYPNISVEEKILEIRNFDTEHDWTSKVNDKVLLEHVKDYIEISKWLQKECEKYKLPFIDISKNRDKVINDFIKMIKSKN